MKQTITSAGVAHWSASQPHGVQITDEDSSLLGWYPIALPGHHAGLETLWHTGWHAYPGRQWQEEPPGAWSRPVFRHDINRQR